MTIEDLDRLQSKAMDQIGKPHAAAVAITPGQLLELCRLARLGYQQEAQEEKPA